jgi:GntR family transcriptional regulator
LRFYSFGRLFRDAGKDFASRVVEASVIQLPPDFADRFAPAEDKHRPSEGFYQIVRLRILEAIPLILERAIIPVHVAPGIIDRDLEAESIYDLLERDYGQSISGATEYIEPRIVRGQDAGILGIAAGCAVFYTERLTRNMAGHVIEVRTSLIRGDKIRFSTELSLGLSLHTPANPPSPRADVDQEGRA